MTPAAYTQLDKRKYKSDNVSRSISTSNNRQGGGGLHVGRMYTRDGRNFHQYKKKLQGENFEGKVTEAELKILIPVHT